MKLKVRSIIKLSFNQDISKRKIKYELEGMNCGGCVCNVRHALLQVHAITEAEAQLNHKL
jgi:hypothetical protein